MKVDMNETKHLNSNDLLRKVEYRSYSSVVVMLRDVPSTVSQYVDANFVSSCNMVEFYEANPIFSKQNLVYIVCITKKNTGENN